MVKFRGLKGANWKGGGKPKARLVGIYSVSNVTNLNDLDEHMEEQTPCDMPRSRFATQKDDY